MLNDRAAGMTYREIGLKNGISKQRVGQLIGQYNRYRFRAIKKESCAYASLREWMNERCVTRTELAQMMGIAPDTEEYEQYIHYMIGSGSLPGMYMNNLADFTGLSRHSLVLVG